METTGSFQNFMENFDTSSDAAAIDDLSEASFSKELAYTTDMLAQLLAIDTNGLDFEDKIDWRFAHSILRGNEIRQSRHQSWKRDPRVYMQFRTLGNIVEGPDNLEEKMEKLKERLTLVPKQLKNGQEQITQYVPRFQELALFMAENSQKLFNHDLPDFVARTDYENALMPLIREAQKSLDSYIEFLGEKLAEGPKSNFAMGTETYNQMLKEEFLLDYTHETLWEYGKMKFDETVAELEILAKEIDPTKTWQQLAIEIKNDYPEPHKMVDAHQLWVDSSKAHILNKKLIPIPWNERVAVVPRAEYLRKTSYYGNFSRAQGKDQDSIFMAQWMINPFEDQWDEKTKQEYLVEHDWGVIIVTAPHEAYGGHHVQGLYQMHNPRKIRRENGLSLFSEGWGLYNEQLMSETGFFPNKRIHLRQLQLRLWRNARVVYDVGMHTGKMSYEEAISMMTDKVGFLRWAAQLEIDSAARSPGYFIGYFMGMSEILRIRELYRQKMGDGFTLSDFHEKLLKLGNMPPKLMEESLLFELGS
ncbi:DUF885 domain-containing protein [Maribacter halichondriae]|uniref:DUF885 domain-containing protein n=1 Tax=Maribacter halichondriae TaxID=2980554 RepID=UPI002358E686|nr:DUF885 domain-containing protein [Maribacter sp. Hal144]